MHKLLLLLILSIFITPQSLLAGFVDHIAAVVNNVVILESDIVSTQKTISLRKELDPLFGFEEQLQKNNPSREHILEFLIQESLIGQAYKVSDAELEEEINNVKKNNQLSQDELNAFLKSKGFNYTEYTNLMKVGLQKRNLLDREIRTRVNISNEDIRNYFVRNMNLQQSDLPVEYSIHLISILKSNYKTTALARKTAEDALKSIRQGESFSEIAKRISDDPSSENGGDLGYLPAKEMAESLRAAAKNLKIGEISEVINAPASLMIVKLTDIRTNESEQLEKAKDQIREILAKDEYKRQLLMWAERARSDAYIQINSK